VDVSLGLEAQLIDDARCEIPHPAERDPLIAALIRELAYD